MVVASVAMRAKAEKVEELKQTMILIAERVRLEQGCLSCHFSQSLECPQTFWWIEEWAAEADLERHRASPESGVINGAGFLLQETPTVHVDYIERRQTALLGRQ